MKYKSIIRNAPKRFTVSDFGGGISCSHNNFEGDGCFDDGYNMWHKNGVLKTRPSLRAGTECYMPLELVNIKKLTVTDTVYYKNGTKYNIAYYSTGNGVAYEHIYIYLVSDKNNIEPLGKILNYRVDAQTFYNPESIVFIVGEKTYGLGIYAFLTLVKRGGASYRIFEAVEDSEEWYFVNNENRYTPTLLYNGRGNNAHQAIEAFELDLGTETSPEQANLINPEFKAYYSSDGLSWSFNLPFTNLDSENVKCEVYMTDSDKITFNIPATGGDTKTYGGTEITAYCDRNEGRLYFLSSGTAYPIPQIVLYPRNNIIVTAYKTTDDGEAKIIGCTGSVVFNSRVYLYGNKIKPNEVYCCFISNPLYFPKNAKAALGSPVQKIVAAGYQNDKLIVFKEGETYKVNTVSKANVISAGNEFILADTLSSDTISTKVGCMAKETLASDSGQLIWLSSDKKVYTLEATTYGSEKNIFEISEKADKFLQEKISPYEKPFATAENGYYYLFSGDTVFVCNCHITNMGYAKRYGSQNSESVSWYIWKLPHNKITGVMRCNETLVSVVDELKGIQYFASFSDTPKDSVITGYEDEEFTVEEKPVKFGFTSKNYLFKSIKDKKIERLTVDIERENPIDIKLKTDKEVFKKHIHNCNGKALLIPDIFSKPTVRTSFSVEGEGEAALFNAAFEYKAVN